MKAKICCNEVIYRVSSLPDSFEDLIKLISSTFDSQLPKSWTLQYKDSDGDNILITDEKDYEEFKNNEPGAASAIPKIHVISAEAFKANNAVVNKPDVIQLEASEIKREEDYQVIEGEDKEENEDNKPEEMIEVKEEVPEAVPVQEEQDKAEPKEIEEKDEIIKESEVQEEPRESEEQQDEQNEEQERKKPEEPEKAEEQDDVKAPEELHEPEEVMEKQEEKEEKEEEPKVQEPEVEEEEVRYYAPIPNKELIEEEPRVEEEEIVKPIEEKPVEDREEQKSNVMESQYSKILAPIQEKLKDSYEVLGSKILVGADDLKFLVSSIIEQKMPEIAQFTHQHIEEQRSQLSQSMVMDQSLLISEEFRPKPVVPKVTHYDTKCMGCGMAPIQGIRYKCTICPSFDYCEQCEEAGTHPHNFVKMRQRDVQDIFRPPQQLKPVAPVIPDWKKNEKEMKEKEMKEKESVKQKPVQDAKRYDRLIETAKKLQKCFPKEDFDMLCVFINDCPADMSIEELVENYKLGLKKD